ncbi:hypothetical protein DACRYDRAFT_22321 [Dacryopinax primogenitus]|uniref:Uncharacterized protein n=1 Tax=Dacryopinax primogenitus (strain DJM 731) TaxID=1858805 RepID=M5FVM6_DACPD|nr:uncharacterized protein DACRYDRAFT_22321 [Dacryopinax primogenitus]EJU01881.1 hypothetical protein DACRYDRAFT_22321 [Dacryopinax primogenitus]
MARFGRTRRAIFVSKQAVGNEAAIDTDIYSIPGFKMTTVTQHAYNQCAVDKGD